MAGRARTRAKLRRISDAFDVNPSISKVEIMHVAGIVTEHQFRITRYQYEKYQLAWDLVPMSWEGIANPTNYFAPDSFDADQAYRQRKGNTIKTMVDTISRHNLNLIQMREGVTLTGPEMDARNDLSEQIKTALDSFINCDLYSVRMARQAQVQAARIAELEAALDEAKATAQV